VNPALDWLAEMSEEEFRRVFRKTALQRTKRSGLRRNAVIAMGNSGNPKFLPALEKLTKDDDPAVAESARWAKNELLENEQ
jgi:epoxyqueuosine reductase